MRPFVWIKFCYVIDKSVTVAQSAQNNAHNPALRMGAVVNAEYTGSNQVCGFLFSFGVTFLKLVALT